MVRYLFYTIGDLTYQSPLVLIALTIAINGKPFSLMNNILFPNLLLKNEQKH